MINRRTAIKSLTVGGLTLLGSLSADKVLARNHLNLPRYSWIFLYWIPYDNDLSYLGDAVMTMLKESIQTDNVLAIVQADFAQQPTLSRTIISSSGVDSYFLDSEDSSDPEMFTALTDWAAQSYQADNWVVAFMGHGGRLTQISPDYNTGKSGSQQRNWMEIIDIRDVILRFNQQTGQSLELFFFQNCNKGTLEACNIMSPTANYILASQDLLGAPNYHYSNVFQFLGTAPNISGKQLAHRIREFETSDMYLGYTVVDCDRISEITVALNTLIDSILQQPWEHLDLAQVPRIPYFGDTYVDIVIFLSTLSEQTQTEPVYLNNLVSLLEQVFEYLPNTDPLEFITFQRLYLTEPEIKPIIRYLESLSGLSVYLPESSEDLDRYVASGVYEGLNLPTLFNRLLHDGKLG
ncbi:clostripain family peptidase [Leptolyngbya sp. PCC 7375]|nr:clostripain family peptidase [Leptolyngbya sp. PCC 7375]